MLDYVNTYAVLDYMHVPTYVPVLVLLARGEGLLLAFNMGAAVLGGGKALTAGMAAVLYVDAIVFPSRQSIESYVGGILPVALALLTNSSVLWLRGDFVVLADSLFILDVSWAVVCVCVMILVCAYPCRVSVLLPYCIVAVAGVLGAAHVFFFEGVYHTSVSEFVVRIMLFYTSVVMFYALRSVVPGVSPRAHALMTLHCALPVLWLQSVVLYVYFLTCVVCILYVMLHAKPQAMRHAHYSTHDDSRHDFKPKHTLPAQPVPETVHGTHALPGTPAQHAPGPPLHSDAADTHILLEELRRAKMQQGLGDA